MFALYTAPSANTRERAGHKSILKGPSKPLRLTRGHSGAAYTGISFAPEPRSLVCGGGVVATRRRSRHGRRNERAHEGNPVHDGRGQLEAPYIDKESLQFLCAFENVCSNKNPTAIGKNFRLRNSFLVTAMKSFTISPKAHRKVINSS